METSVIHGIIMQDIDDIDYLDVKCHKEAVYFFTKSGYVLDDDLQKLIYDESLNKRQQCQLIGNKEFGSEQIVLFLAESSKRGYKYMRKTYEQIPTTYTDEQIPLFATIKDDGTVEQVGSSMSEKGVKNFILERKRTNVQMAYNDSHWHCFIFDYSGLAGRESGKMFSGISHCHYISDKFGMDMDRLFEALSAFCHPGLSTHMRLTYRKSYN